jgi:hypothetical protein
MSAEIGAPRANKGGRPRCAASPEQVHALRARGLSWGQIAKTLEIGKTTAARLARASVDGGPVSGREGGQ